MAEVSPSVAACMSDMAAEILALRARLAAVEVLCDEARSGAFDSRVSFESAVRAAARGEGDRPAVCPRCNVLIDSDDRCPNCDRPVADHIAILDGPPITYPCCEHCRHDLYSVEEFGPATQPCGRDGCPGSKPCDHDMTWSDMIGEYVCTKCQHRVRELPC